MAGTRPLQVEPAAAIDLEFAPIAESPVVRLITAHLTEQLPAGEARLDVHQVRLLRHHPGKRVVFALTLRAGDRCFTLIAKASAKDRAHVYRLMEELRRTGLGPQDRFSIPQPIAYLQPLRLMLQEKVEGDVATDRLLSHDRADWTDAAERCAQWLATFHGMSVRDGASFDASSQLHALQEWTSRVAAISEPLASRAVPLFERLEAASPALSDVELCTIHGDYSHHQVILGAERTVTIDWDRFCLADPGLDAARFVVGLQRLALRRRGALHDLDAPASVFLDTYLASAPAGVAARLPFHRAAICLEHAKHDVHKRADGWLERASATLDEGLRVLAEGC